jgi:hypothetical protein
MPSIPATRKKILGNANEDRIQSSLTRKYCRNINVTTRPKQHVTTLDVDRDFIKLLNNSNNEAQKIRHIVKNITTLFHNLSFSSKQFTSHVIDQAINKVRLLECFYKVVSHLNVICLSLHTLLDQLPSIESNYLELVSNEEDIAETYIPFFKKDLLNDYFKQDGKQLVDFTS